MKTNKTSDKKSPAKKSTNKKSTAKKSSVSFFSDTYKMETETVYYESGAIKTFPLAYELGQQITRSGGTVRMKAKVEVDSDGNVAVTPYKQNSGERYRLLFRTAHGIVKETDKDVIVKLQFHKSRGRLNVCDMLEDEVDDISGFLETTNDIQKWQ